MIVVTCCLRNAETIIFEDGTCCWYWVGLHLQPSSPAGRGGWLFGGHNEDFDLGFFGVGLGDRSGSISLSLYFSAHAVAPPATAPAFLTRMYGSIGFASRNGWKVQRPPQRTAVQKAPEVEPSPAPTPC